MRERRGRIGRTVGAVADSIASAARRGGSRAGEPRVVVYDAGGRPTLLRPDADEHKLILDAAERMIDLWRVPGAGPPDDAG
ncbi:MAG: hypothetical protein QOG63_3145 [Thermoleophilaceae bacterium]|jgi:hypothetical protein|nr:hypothetical protein [Thermoleophilaceae bacterium]